jgi:DNA-binding SARP family transcriptional activator
VGEGVQRLLAFLALRGQRERSFIAGTLWPDCSEAQAHANLRATLSRLRRRDHVDIVDASRASLRLRTTVKVDVHDLIRTASGVLSGTPYSWWTAVRQLTGDQLLLGWYDDWVLHHREQMRQLCLHGLESIADDQHKQGHYSAAVQAGLASIAIEPLRESAHRQVIRAHLAAGNRGEAIRQYESLRRLLLTEMGAEPSDEAVDLFSDPVRRSNTAG